MKRVWKSLILGVFALGLFGCLERPLLRAVIETHPDPPRGPYPLHVIFKGYGSEGNIVEWIWTFFRLEGKEEVPLGGALSGPEVEYVFETRGSYRVYLTVRDPDQNFAQAHIDVDVRSQPPVASLFADPYPEIQVGKVITFDASKSFDPDGVIIRYFWDFGDGFWTETTEPKVSHSYGEPKEYRVQLVVEDDYGDQAKTELEVRVVPKGCGSCP